MSFEEFKERLHYFPVIFITGGDGLVGSRCRQLFSQRYAEFTSTDIGDFDITNSEAVNHRLKRVRPDVLINFSAKINVLAIEKERGNYGLDAGQVNAIGAKNLAEACRENNIFLVHISTDYVFPGYPPVPLNQGPFAENSSVAHSSEGTNWYGWTKREGERFVQEAMGSEGKFAIVRIARPFRADFERTDFARNILKLYSEGKLYPMMIDMTIAPTFIDELVKALKKVIEKEDVICALPPNRRILHVVSRDQMSLLDHSRCLIKTFTGQEPKIEGIYMSDFYRKNPGMYQMPRRGLLCDRTQELLEMRFMSCQEQIEELCRQRKALGLTL